MVWFNVFLFAMGLGIVILGGLALLGSILRSKE
ncbi:hypothetical protein FHS76_001239 [Ochrobactrum daejeonense]|uniref:Uncharacterized protein n=1 Tax=Brucella daejeonensis TaxID=659015 RepID=A0A7W9AVI7_9HYPH|nr:hypothetical protein [Brucella daejeonensis]